MSADSTLEPCIRLCLDLPNGTEATVVIPRSELKRILVSLGERDYLRSQCVEMLLLSLGLEEA
jgi:hypothetical protein